MQLKDLRPGSGRAAIRSLEERVADAWHPFCDWAGGWLRPQRGEGFEALHAAYLDVLEGEADPQTPHVLKL